MPKSALMLASIVLGRRGRCVVCTGTAITLSNPGGRSVVWSGACSSARSGTRTCRFTPNGSATVTANVR